MLYDIYFTVLYQPLLNTLVVIYETVAFRDLGIALTLFTVLMRIVLFPVFHRQTKFQVAMQNMKPELDRIKEKHKGDLEKQAEAQMALYREHGVNPFVDSGMMILQLPVLIAIFDIMQKIVNPDAFRALYSFVPIPAVFSTMSLGVMDLAAPSMVMVVLAALAQYAATVITMPAGTGRLAALIGPVLIVWIFRGFPAALGLYLIVMSVVSFLQHRVTAGRIENHGKHGVHK